jgi:hypothetical protein
MFAFLGTNASSVTSLKCVAAKTRASEISSRGQPRSRGSRAREGFASLAVAVTRRDALAGRRIVRFTGETCRARAE